jgi:hypothetical protein
VALILLEASILLTWIIGCARKCSLLAVFLTRREWNLFYEHWNERELWPGKTGNETPEIFSVNILFLRWFLPLESIAKYLLLWNTLIHFCSYITLYFHVQNKWQREVGWGVGDEYRERHFYQHQPLLGEKRGAFLQVFLIQFGRFHRHHFFPSSHFQHCLAKSDVSFFKLVFSPKFEFVHILFCSLEGENHDVAVLSVINAIQFQSSLFMKSPCSSQCVCRRVREHSR